MEPSFPQHWRRSLHGGNFSARGIFLSNKSCTQAIINLQFGNSLKEIADGKTTTI
jgi:hypothetical protein